MVLIILSSHMDIVASPMSFVYSYSSREASSFIQMVNQYFCLCLSRNAVSPVPQVFEIISRDFHPNFGNEDLDVEAETVFSRH